MRDGGFSGLSPHRNGACCKPYSRRGSARPAPGACGGTTKGKASASPVVSADVDSDRHRAQQRAGRVRDRGFDEFGQVLPKLGVAGVAMEAAVVERPSAQAIPFALVREPPEFVTSPSLHLGSVLAARHLHDAPGGDLRLQGGCPARRPRRRSRWPRRARHRGRSLRGRMPGCPLA